jgi:hypothetical protein
VRIDHVIWATADLDAGAERLAGVGEGLMGWAVSTEDVTAVAARLGTELAGPPGRSGPARGGDRRAGATVIPG